MKTIIGITALFLLIACTPTVKNSLSQTSTGNQVDSQNYTNMDKRHNQLLREGQKLLAKGKREIAIVNYFNPIIKDYERIYAYINKRLYSARTQEEYEFYKSSAKSENRLALVLSETWSLAYYLKAYALLELKELKLAKKSMQKALALAPSNSKYLSEMGHIYHLDKNMNSALKSYLLAEKSASFFSPKSLKKSELLRAKRGIGFSYTELNQLNRAENIYREVLAIDSSDKIAKRELKYIQELKKKN